MSGEKLSFGGGVTFGRSKSENLDDNMDGLTVEERKHAEEYRQRARDERRRFVNATDTEFWLCLCFPDERTLGKWRKAMGFGDLHEIVRADDVVGAFGEVDKSGCAVAFGGGLSFGGLGFGGKTPDPLADVTYSGDLEADCLSELEALHECFVAAASPVKLVEPTDSDVWFVIAWPDRDGKDEFINRCGLRKFGDKYMDGVAVAKKLGVNL